MPVWTHSHSLSLTFIMRSKMRSTKITSVKPSIYPALTFNIIRAFALLSSIVVGLILAVFIYHLHADNYKLPFAFLIVGPPSRYSPDHLHKQQQADYTLPPSTAPHNSRLLPPQCPLHNSHKLQLRPLAQTLHNLQHHYPPPVAPLPRPP